MALLQIIKGDSGRHTTARHQLTEEEHAKQPASGQLWSDKLPHRIKGLAVPGHLCSSLQVSLGVMR